MGSEVVAALLGALAAGGWQTAVGIFDRRRERATLLSSIVAEVSAICGLIRAQRYLESSIALQQAIGSPDWEAHPAVLVADVRADYFVVFHGLSAKLGSLDCDQAVKIVTFYQYCKSAVDSHRPDGVIPVAGSRDEREAHIHAGVALFQAILSLGDEITQLAKLPPPQMLLRLLPQAH